MPKTTGLPEISIERQYMLAPPPSGAALPVISPPDIVNVTSSHTYTPPPLLEAELPEMVPPDIVNEL